MKHTPTPWSINTVDDYASYGKPTHMEIIHDGKYNKCFVFDKEDAEFIVRAVNSHEELLEAAKDMMKVIEELKGQAGIPKQYMKLFNAIQKAESK